MYSLSVASQRAWVGRGEIAFGTVVRFALRTNGTMVSESMLVLASHEWMVLTEFEYGSRRCFSGGFQMCNWDKDNGAC